MERPFQSLESRPHENTATNLKPKIIENLTQFIFFHVSKQLYLHSRSFIESKMKGLVRIIAIFAAVFALSGTRGGASLSDREAQTEFQEAFIFQETEDWEFDRHEFPALNNGGLAFSVARTVSEASRVRNLSEERNGSSQHPRTGFCRSGKIVCTARSGNFVIDRVIVPIPGYLSGLSSSVILRRLRI